MSNTWSTLSAALAGIPELRGARCRGQWLIWDETADPEIIEYAKNQCQACPVLAECRSWVDSLKPTKRPPGVVAGEVRYARFENKGTAS